MGRGRPRKPVVLSPLYLDLRFLAQSGGDLVPYHHTEGHQAGSFRFVKKPIERIQTSTDNYSQTSKPFVRTAATASILHKIELLCKFVSGTQH